MPFVYWSACGEDFPPAGATEWTGQRVEKARAGHEENERVELHMSFELGFAAMRVVLRNLTEDILMDMPGTQDEQELH